MPSLPLFNAMLKVCARAADLDRAKSGTTHSVCVCFYFMQFSFLFSGHLEENLNIMYLFPK